MHTMLLRFLTIQLISLTAAFDDPQEFVTVSNDPAHFSQRVFLGKHEAVPLNEGFLISLDPGESNENMVVPSNLMVAFETLDRMLPRWYKLALLESRHNYECLVILNGINISNYVRNWTIVNWIRSNEGSALKGELQRLGAQTEAQFGAGIVDGYCLYSKYGFNEAMRIMLDPLSKGIIREIPSAEEEVCDSQKIANDDEAYPDPPR